MAIQPVEGNQFGGRSFCVPEVLRPVILIDGRNHRFLIGQHLANAIGIHDFHVSQMAQDFQDAPFIGRGFVAQRLVWQTGNGRCDLFGTFLRCFQMLLQFSVRHGDPQFKKECVRSHYRFYRAGVSTLKVLLLISLSGTLPSLTTTCCGGVETSIRIAFFDFARTSSLLLSSPLFVCTVTGTSAPASPRFSTDTVTM